MYPLSLSPALHRLGSESMPRKELLARPADVPPVADHARRAGEALEHHRPVAFCDDAPAEQHHRPRVALAPDQPAEALLELERRVGNEVVGEAVQAARLESLEPRRGERLARHAERQLRERSEEHTSELQSHSDLVCRLLLEKKKKKT